MAATKNALRRDLFTGIERYGTANERRDFVEATLIRLAEDDGYLYLTEIANQDDPDASTFAGQIILGQYANHDSQRFEPADLHDAISGLRVELRSIWQGTEDEILEWYSEKHDKIRAELSSKDIRLARKEAPLKPISFKTRMARPKQRSAAYLAGRGELVSHGGGTQQRATLGTVNGPGRQAVYVDQMEHTEKTVAVVGIQHGWRALKYAGAGVKRCGSKRRQDREWRFEEVHPLEIKEREAKAKRRRQAAQQQAPEVTAQAQP